jgi:hypothetical protein
MKSKILLVLSFFWHFLSMPLAGAQSLDAGATGPVPPPTAALTQWREGYITWKGTRVFEPDWRTFRSDHGDTFVIDMKSIVKNTLPSGTLVRVVAYLVEGDDYDPKRLIQFAFNCKDFYEVVTSVSRDQLQPVEEQARKLACQ